MEWTCTACAFGNNSGVNCDICDAPRDGGEPLPPAWTALGTEVMPEVAVKAAADQQYDNRNVVVVIDEDELLYSELSGRPVKRKRKHRMRSTGNANSPGMSAPVIILDDDEDEPATSDTQTKTPAVEPSSSKAAAAVVQFVCGICMCEDTEGVLLKRCNHQYCLECMAIYVSQKVREGACPSVDPQK